MSVVMFSSYPVPALFVRSARPIRKLFLGGAGVGSLPLPSDPVGQVTITFSGVKAGSEIKLISSGMTIIAGTDSASFNTSFVVDKYTVGSANNVIRILIIALGYEIIDISFTIPQSDASIPVFQRIDRTYNNPA